MESVPQLDLASALLPLAGVIFTVAIGVILLNQHFRKNLYKQSLEQEALRTRHQLELLQASIDAEEKARKRIAQDLHDELGATLAITRMHLVQLGQQTNVGEKVTTSLQAIRGLTETALASTRRISHELMPPQLESFGLIKTLQAAADQLQNTVHLTVSFAAPEQLPSLPASTELALYRICMELIHNTIKHSGARTIELALTDLGSRLLLVYQDDGRGLPDGGPSTGLGFRSIEARVNSVGGVLQIGKEGQKGFYASIEIDMKV